MEGSYGCMNERSESFRIDIKRFVLGEGLHEFPPNRFRRGQCVRHRTLGYVGVVADFDMYFARAGALSEEGEASSLHSENPELMRPWYHILINETDRVAYVAEDHLEQIPLHQEIHHPIIGLFFDGHDDEIFIRNKKTWKDLG
jgi:hemimethylated DNA binding protein